MSSCKGLNQEANARHVAVLFLPKPNHLQLANIALSCYEPRDPP